MNSTQGPQTIIGNVFACGAAIIGIPFGAIKGGLDAMQGGSFVEGMAEGFFGSYEKAGEFGDKHGGKIVSRLFTGILIGLGADISHHFHDHDA